MGMKAMTGLALLMVAACSSSSESDAPICKVAGTYVMTATPQTASEGCPLKSGEAGPPVTITITPSGETFAVEMQGAQGGCTATVPEACKLQTKCDLVETDAIDPGNRVGTLQFSWTFNATGFSGLNSGSLPPAGSLPKGCTFQSSATATRQ